MALHTAQDIARLQIDQTVIKSLITPTQWRIDLVLSSVLVMLSLRRAGM
ncbi:MAG: hypothetical protein M3O62_17385 [Pseudomonadota bacterium]|nr:hypothetical protein [Pseudomonadota bacterium]